MARSAILRRLGGALTALLLALPLAATGEGEELPFSKLELPEPQRHFSATQECVEPQPHGVHSPPA